MREQDIAIKLLKEWQEKLSGLDSGQKEQLEKWLLSYMGKTEELYYIYQKISESSSETYTETGITLPKEQWQHLLSGAIDLMQPVLPLGSVVDLKKEKLQEKVPKLEQVERVRIVITQRFLSYTPTGYFTYAGVVYPVGNMQGNQVIQFNPMMIEKVVHKGYEDEQDAAYIYFMKQEYVLREDMRNYEFVSREEGEQLIKQMEGNHVKGN